MLSWSRGRNALLRRNVQMLADVGIDCGALDELNGGLPQHVLYIETFSRDSGLKGALDARRLECRIDSADGDFREHGFALRLDVQPAANMLVCRLRGRFLRARLFISRDRTWTPYRARRLSLADLHGVAGRPYSINGHIWFLSPYGLARVLYHKTECAASRYFEPDSAVGSNA